MGKHYEQLKPEEWARVMRMNREGPSLRAISRALKRSPSTISREINRHRLNGHAYDAAQAGDRAQACRFQRRKTPKLVQETVLFGVVEHFFGRAGHPNRLLALRSVFIPINRSSGCLTGRVRRCGISRFNTRIHIGYSRYS
jgi:IS30 family transposase